MCQALGCKFHTVDLPSKLESIRSSCNALHDTEFLLFLLSSPARVDLLLTSTTPLLEVVCKLVGEAWQPSEHLASMQQGGICRRAMQWHGFAYLQVDNALGRDLPGLGIEDPLVRCFKTVCCMQHGVAAWCMSEHCQKPCLVNGCAALCNFPSTHFLCC